MTEQIGPLQRLPHQRSADAEAPHLLRHRERAEQQAGMTGSGHDRPQPQGADQAAATARDKREAARRLAALAQPLRGPGEAARTECGVEQTLSRRHVRTAFPADRNRFVVRRTR